MSFFDLFRNQPPDSHDGQENEGSFLDLFRSENSRPTSETYTLPTPLAPSPDRLFWAMRDLPITEATQHFLICGMTGSGKSTCIQLFLQSIAPRFFPDDPYCEQLILFDAKCDALPLLDALGHPPDSDYVWVLNPFDERSVVWNLAEAVQSPAMARAFATLLIPEERNTNAPFFADGSRELVYATIMGLNHTAGPNWTFRDLLCALDSIEHIQAVSKAEPRAYRLVSRIMEDDKDLRGILSTLGTRMGRFEQVAALWNSNSNPRKFSIQDFLSNPGILVLGYDPVLNDSIWPINALLLKALTNEILRRPNTLTPKTWFVLDEFRAMQKVDCIHDLLNRGRSKGASVMLGIQSVEGMEEVYGEKGANDLLGQCANKTFLRAGGPHTAQWAERYFGHTRQMESIRSESWNQDGRSQSVQHSVQERSLFLSSFFMDLPSPKPGRWMISVNDVPAEGSVFITRRWFEQLLSWTLPASDAPALIPRDEISEQILQSWDEHEEKYFCGSDATENPDDVQLPEAGSWQNREDSNRDA